MATIRQMLAPEAKEKVYAVKDALKRDDILRQDPMWLNRIKFERYLTAKAEAILGEDLGDGKHPNEAYRHAQLVLHLLDQQWREEAKRLATGQTSAAEAVAGVIHNAAVAS